MNGTEKQIAWASDIKKQAYKALSTLESAIQSEEDFAPSFIVQSGEKEIAVDYVKMIVSVKNDGKRIKSRLNMDDLNAVKMCLDQWFESPAGQNSRNIIDQRSDFTILKFHELMVEFHKTGTWHKNIFECVWYNGAVK